MKKIISLLTLSCVLTLTGFSQTHAVDNFTGDFSYSLPLLNLPGGNGPDIPVFATYNAGITVEQKASEIGLGWRLDVGGEIERRVMGLPDDWKDVDVPHAIKQVFSTQNGIFNLNNCFDFYTSSYKMDTNIFTFPNYDMYAVKGGAVSGLMQPRFPDYLSLTKHEENPATSRTIWVGSSYIGFYPITTYNFDEFMIPITSYSAGNYNKPQFRFLGDFNGTVDLRHYPWDEQPINGSTPVRLPGDVFDGSDASYEGDYSTSTNRILGSKYVEYFTNQEINDGQAGNFVDVSYPAYTRTSGTCDLNGIGGFRITSANGFTYHYSLPVYQHSSITGQYPLNHDYSLTDPENLTRTLKSNGYIYKNQDSIALEYKQAVKTALTWKLTAVTGPDYNDADNDGKVGEGDAGYWIRYDYVLWADHFLSSDGATLGAAIKYSPFEDDFSKTMPVDSEDKNHLKNVHISISDKQIYYLNKIVSSTHSLLFVRELRNDEQSIANAYEEIAQSGGAKINIGSNVRDWERTAWKGKLFDNGGPDAPMTQGVREVTIAPSGADHVELTFDFFSFQYIQDLEWIEIYDGSSSGDPTKLLGRYGSIRDFEGTTDPICYDPTGITDDLCQVIANSVITSTEPAVTIKVHSRSFNTAGFGLTWKGKWNNGRPKTVPQLKLKKIMLLANEDLSYILSLAEPNDYNIDNNSASFHSMMDLSQTNASFPDVYHIDWYNNVSQTIHDRLIEEIDFQQDYSLAKKYYGNVNHRWNDAILKTDAPDVVHSKIYFDTDNENQTGKLTLKKIRRLHSKHVQLIPSYKFDYAQNNTTWNPEYNPVKTDHWGFYNSNADYYGMGEYHNNLSAQLVSAWSLRNITMPMGEKLEIGYEADRYAKFIPDEMDNFNPDNYQPYYIFPIKSATMTNLNTFSWEIELETNQFYDVINDLNINQASIILPFTSAENYCFHDEFLFIGERNLFDLTLGDVSLTTPITFHEVNTLAAFGKSGNDEIIDETNHGGFFSGCSNTDIRYAGHGFIYVQLAENENLYGGGLRVKTLISSNGNEKYFTSYEYKEGVALSVKDQFSQRKIQTYDSGISSPLGLREISTDLHKPIPSVGYTFVTLKNYGLSDNSLGEIEYKFITADKNNNCYFPTQVTETYGSCGGEPSQHSLVDVTDKFSSHWGLVESAVARDQHGNTISKTMNEYANTVQGATVEGFRYNKIGNSVSLGGGQSCNSIEDVICTLRRFPTRLIKQTNYTGGLSESKEFLSFDEISGEALLFKSSSKLEGTFITEKIPAYKIPAYSSAGPKTIDVANRNLLGSIAVTKVKKDNDLINNEDLVSYEVTTFSKTRRMRKYNSSTQYYEYQNINHPDWSAAKFHKWDGDLTRYGTFDINSITDYNFAEGATNSDKWLLLNEITLWDEQERALEQKDLANRYAAKKYAYNNKLIIGEVSNCNYASFTNCGFENKITEAGNTSLFEGELYKFGGWGSTDVEQIKSNASIEAHTGDYYLKVAANNLGARYRVLYDANDEYGGLLRGRKYKASVWVHNSSSDNAYIRLFISTDPIVIATRLKNDSKNIQVGDWTLMTVEVEIPNNLNTGSMLQLFVNNDGATPAYFDDLRFHLSDVQMEAYVYDKNTQQRSAILDANNFATKYKYDEAGREIEVWKEFEQHGLKKVQETQHGYARTID